jgi:phenylacetate-coenzyme A ligase PaaK-like adenylate-forming protein
VGGTFWTLVLRSEPGIKEFQVVQKAINRIQVNYVPEDELTTVIPVDQFTEKIHKYSGKELYVEFKEVDHIPLTKGGKFRFVVKAYDN